MSSVKWDDGTTTVQGCLERPLLLFEHGRPTHLFAATADGPGGFDRARNTWTTVLPLTPNYAMQRLRITFRKALQAEYA